MADPRFSIVAAVYNVERYLDAFIASIEAQTFPLDRVEVIAVDDGSTDHCLTRLQEWAHRRPELVRVLSKPNGGQASARNLGLTEARGEWVTFTDPDDMIEPPYLAAVDAFLRAHPTTDMVGCRRIVLDDASGERRIHPLDHHFHAGDRLVDLDASPTLFYGSAPCAFLPRKRLIETGLTFDERIRPNFEDAHFLGCYLLSRPAPQVGFVASAEYLYRRRSDGSSTLQTSRTDDGRFTTVPRLGHLDLLRRCAERETGVPRWAQNLVLYDLLWNFDQEDLPAGARLLRGPVAEEFHGLLAQIVRYLEPTTIKEFNGLWIPQVWREILAHGYADQPWRPGRVVRDKRDERAKLDRIRYRFTGEPPVETFTVDGEPVEPVHAKTRDLPYFDRTIIRERLVWLPRGKLTVTLDGAGVVVRKRDPRPISRDPGPVTEPESSGGLPSRDALIGRLARSRLVRRMFRQAWVLIDRVHDADDSGEHLFRYLRAEQPTVNAWFAIEKGTPDDKRLRADGYGRRMVPYGSLRWKLLMLNAEHLVSSHADAAITNPPLLRSLMPVPTWRYSFLNHGVIKDDLSAWLNPKNIEIFVTSTPGEYESICGEGTRYVYTSKEAALTGMPRFDKVREAGLRFPPDKRDLILIAPTWRTWLVAPLAAGSQRRQLAAGFAETEFARQWRAVLGAPELAELAARTGLTVATLLHPNLQAVQDELELPAHVRTFGFVGHDVRELFARSRVVVTDYSSMAFNAAYIDRPVVYFQFDHEAMFGGAHVGRGGYFKYERDGFGPVTFEASGTLAAIRDIVESGPDPAEEYRRRIAEAFPQRDGRCSERVYRAIVASARPPSETVSAGRKRPAEA